MALSDHLPIYKASHELCLCLERVPQRFFAPFCARCWAWKVNPAGIRGGSLG
jgi:hypothetical protein